MAAIVRRVNASGIAANTRTRLYTVPAGKVAVLRTLTQGNDNTTAITMGAEVNGAGFLWSNTVAGSSAMHWPLGTVLYEGQYMNVEHNAGSAYSMLQYVEMDRATEGRNLWQWHAVNIHSATATYTVPAGKRVRVREVVVCPHSTVNSNQMSIYINSIGHFLKGSYSNTVLGTDMSVNPGEIIGASAAATYGTHVFLSGVIEDA